MACGLEKFRYAQDDFVLTHSGKTAAFVSGRTQQHKSKAKFDCCKRNREDQLSIMICPSCLQNVGPNRLVQLLLRKLPRLPAALASPPLRLHPKACPGPDHRVQEHLIENEVAVLRRVRHPSIIQLIEVDETPTQLFLVMELVKGGDLFDAITSSTKYSERDASAMVFNLAGAIKYLHRMNIVHRDIKPENLLVCEYPDGTKSLKLGDFGLATVVEGPLYTVCGTPTYVAPEIIAETGQMLQVNVDARFTAEEVLSHPWVTDEAPGESNTVSGPEDHAVEGAQESDRDSPVLETKQVPSPLV
ncbi:Serine/threonine-protein kinase dclk2 [Xenoophorus captivus]|uniref:Serine/threonine-protein kinase dclk2 n=1 Tax=Xenoophorus captivus TaxID=1517983 RepID=A0ABV0QZA1_9TELE